FLFFGYDDNGDIRFDERTGPGRELAAQPDVEGSGNVARPVLGRRTSIEYDVGELHCIFDLLRRERCGGGQLIEQRWSFAIYLGVTAEIGGCFRKIDGHHLYKL